GASMNCRQSRYRAGLPRLRYRLTQPTHDAPGATPVPVRPTAEASVCVPCPAVSVGARVCRAGSYHESDPPRKPLASAGCPPSTPESELPTPMPVPVAPSCDQTRSAPTIVIFHCGLSGPGLAPWLVG